MGEGSAASHLCGANCIQWLFLLSFFFSGNALEAFSWEFMAIRWDLALRGTI